MNRLWAVLGLIAAAAGCAAAPPRADQAKPAPTIERSFYLMGTMLEVSLHGMSRAAGLAASDEVFRVVRQDELRLSTWTPASELSRVNRAPLGRPIRLSPLTERDLRNAYRYALETDFAFDPWIGPLVKAWGLRTGGRVPSPSEQKQAREAARPGAFGWAGRTLVRKLPGASVEEGGFGKGIALDDALEALRRARVPGSVLDFGGQISVYGDRKATIEVSNPAVREQTLLRFETGPGSVSTSGNSEHGMTVSDGPGTRRVGHLLDPAAGTPAAYDGSATVIAPSGIEADCLSAAVFVMGAERGLEWAREHHVRVLWIEPDRRRTSADPQWIAWTSCDWNVPLETLSPQVELRSGCANRKEKT